MEPDWEDLKTILHLSRGKTLAKAGQTLGVNYTTVARRLGRIQESFGQPLFNKLPDGYQVTGEGAKVVHAAQAMELQMADVVRSLTAAQQSISGTLRITAPQLLIKTHLADILQQLHIEHPAIEIEVLATNDFLDLNKTEADIAIRISNDPGNALVGHRLARQHSMAFSTPELAHKIKSESVNSIEWIGLSHWKAPPKASLGRFPDACIAYRFDDMTAVLGAASLGLGVVRLPVFLGDSIPELVRLPDVLSPQPYWDIWVLTHKELRNAPKILAFKEILLPFFRSHQGDFWVEGLS